MQRTARLIRRAIKKYEFSEIPHLIQGKDLEGVELRLPIEFPNEMIELLVNKGVKIHLRNFVNRAADTWEQIIENTHLLKISGFQPSLSLGCSLAFRRYLDLVNIPYQIKSGYGITIGEISEIPNRDIQEKAFQFFFKSDLYYHLRVLLETGYIPSIEELDLALINKRSSHAECTILLTYPIPWTDEFTYRFVKDHYRGGYNVFIFYDPIYQSAWDAIRRYIASDPDVPIKEDIKSFALLGIHTEEMRNNYKWYTSNDGYAICNYNRILITDLDDEKKWKTFIKLAKQNNSLNLCSDPRFDHYWERLTHPDNQPLLKEVIKKNPSAEEYLIHKGLLAKDHNLCELIEADKTRANYKLIELVRDGLVTAEMLGPDHPLTSVIKGRITKRAR